MKPRLPMLLLPLVLLASCTSFWCHEPCEPTSRGYCAPGFEWSALTRVLILPLVNESTYVDAAEDVRLALAAELQAAARFEVVVAPPDPQAVLSRSTRIQGRFDEGQMIELAHQFQADGILLGTVTQYQPYLPPRLGVSLQLISPANAVVIASVDGLWDARDKVLAKRARDYINDFLHPGENAMANELVLSSPHLYQRFVCRQIVQEFVRNYTRSPPPSPISLIPTGDVTTTNPPN